MASVKFYDIGDHPAGFVGYRVIYKSVKNLDKKPEFRQSSSSYYSVKQHGKKEAHDLAHAEAKVREVEAEDAKAYKALCVSTHRHKKGGSIMTIRHFQLGCRAATGYSRAPCVLYVLQPPRHVAMTRQRSFRTEGEFKRAFFELIEFKLDQEIATHAPEWRQYYRDQLPAWSDVLAYFKANHPKTYSEHLS